MEQTKQSDRCTGNSSDDGMEYYNRLEQSIDHPTLNHLRKVARVEAEVVHAKKSMLKNKHRRCTVSKVKTKRQASNKRSAEICRDAKNIYIHHLEDAVYEAEEDYRKIMQSILKQTEQTMKIREQIKRIEEAQEKENQQSSWLQSMDDEDTDLVVNDLFPGDDHMQDVIDEFTLDRASSSAENEEEATEISLDDHEERLLDEFMICAEQHVVSRECKEEEGDEAVKRVDRLSPVSVFDACPEVPILNSLGPSIQSQSVVCR